MILYYLLFGIYAIGPYADARACLEAAEAQRGVNPGQPVAYVCRPVRGTN